MNLKVVAGAPDTGDEIEGFGVVKDAHRQRATVLVLSMGVPEATIAPRFEV